MEFTSDGTWLTLNSQKLDTLSSEVPQVLVKDFEAFQTSTGNTWLIMVDRITGKPSLIEGGVPWIPGTGWNNTLKASDIGVTEETTAANQVPVDLVAEKAVALLKTYPNLFNIDPADLVLMDGASGPMLDYLYNLNFQWTYHGLPVEDAYIGFYMNSGNLVMFGATNISDTIKNLNPVPTLKAETAWNSVWTYLDDQPSAADEITEPGRLLIQPRSVPAVVDNLSYAFGQGLEYRLVYVLSFRREGTPGTWEARVDAHTGELLSFKDVNAYGKIQGGVYKTDKNPTQTEVTMPFPYADYGATSFADIAGNFTGTSGTGTMTGRTGSANNVGSVDMVDNCGSISKASDGTGLIDFLTSSGTDCTTPGSGGSGNTHAARTQYWNVVQIKLKAFTYLYGNNWLEGRLTDNVNINSTCNAYWNGSSVNFYRSGGGCGNTGELPGVSLHEWAHGMDENDGNGASPNGGTGEIYGDTSGMLQTHQSCMGGGFFTSYDSGCGHPPSQSTSFHNCSGYGHCCTDCSGVREADYAKHTGSEMATPNGFNMSHCPTGYSCVGPCNRECHCENAPGIQANWDLAVRVLTAAPYSMDTATAWQYLDKYWYASAPNRTSAFACGNNTSSATGNLFNQYRVVDDCDGNLSNGTPHAAGIYAALGTNHQIGNSSAVNTDNNCSCASLSTPVLSGVAGDAQGSLSWAAITGAASYDVYRNETSCTSGYTKVGNATSTTFTDTPLSNGVTYYYKIQAINGACPPSALSNCVTLTPAAGGCTAPGAPTLNSATGSCTAVALAWTAGTGTTLSYNVYRVAGACGGAYTKLTGPITPTTYSDTSAVAGTQYAYVIRGACDAAGTTESANSNCFTGTRTAVPAAPTGVTATSNRCTDVQVAWSAVPGATSYNVLRGTACGTVLNTFTGVTSPYNDTSAVAGTTYSYWVVAVNACGNSANSSCASGVRLAAPAAPAAPTFTNVSCTTLTVNWSAVSGATAYDVYRKTGACGTGSTVATNLTTTTYNDSGLSASTQYSYYIVAKNTCGSSSSGTCSSVTTTGVPSAPTGLTATGSCTAVDLSWTASTGATSYNVLRTTNSNCSSSLSTIGTSATTTYSDTTAVAGTTYYYVVQAVNTCGTSSNSGCANAARLTVPAAPTGVTATGSCTAVTVTWGTVSGATSYNVLRGTTCGTVVTTFTGVTSPYNDTSAVAGTAYTYWVVAVNACGNSANSSCAAGTRLVSPTPTITGGSANTCPAVTVPLATESGQSSYQWYVGGSPIGGATASTYTATATGNYTVSYTAGNGCSGTSAAHAVTITPCAPIIVYQGNGGFTEETGDGDGVMEAGEKYSVQVTLANTGNVAADNVQASLTGMAAGDGITLCNNPGSFGSIVVGGTSSFAYTFVVNSAVWYGTYACGTNLTFNVVGKSTTTAACTCADEMAVFNATVGAAGGTVTLFGPDDDPYNSGFWTAAGGSSQTATHCSHSTVYYRVNQNGNADLVPSVSTVGYTGVHVVFDAGASATSVVLYLDYSIDGGASYTNVWSRTSVTSWACGQDVTLPSDAEGISNLKIRFRCTSGGQTSRARFDYVLIQASGATNCDTGTATCAAAVPKPVPDGKWVSGTAMRASKVSGNTVHVTWDVTACASGGYNLYSGPLTVVSTYAYDTWTCTLGTGGSADAAVSATGTAQFFLVVPTEGTAEGSHGRNSAGTERGAAGTGHCSIVSKDTSGTCP